MARRIRGLTAWLLCAGVLSIALGANAAAVPAPEQLLPQDTLLLVTAPDFGKLKEIFRKSAENQLWNDPAMKPFRDKFVSKWDEEFVKPLERDLGISLESYAALLQGQVTFALLQNGWQGSGEESLGMVLLVDTKDKSSQLQKNLAELRQKCVDGGKAIRTEKIRDLEFSILSFSTNDVPKTLRKFFPAASEEQPSGEGDSAKAPAKTELVLGQVETALLLGNSTRAVEKVATRLTGGTTPTLGEFAAYQANHGALFREAPLYGWVNAKAFVDVLNRKASEKSQPDQPDPFSMFDKAKLLSACGLAGLKTVAFTMQDSNEGTLFQLFFGVPEASRQGLFKLLAWESKESTAPPFVPGDAHKFQRWRMDGQKAWATLEKMLTDMSPQLIGTLNFLVDSANTYAKEKDPGFDIRKNLIGNLGDDIITYEKAPRAGAEADESPALVLLGSPRPTEFAAALKSVLVFMNQQGGNPSEREFLGRKIFSVPLPSLPLPVPSGGKPAAPRTLSYAASAGYVALSTDAALLEEYLRSSESQAKTLRETPGLAEAVQKVGGGSTGLLGYENQAESMRLAFEAWKKDAGAGAATNAPGFSPSPGGLAMAGPFKGFQEWLDFSLLPGYEKVSKYFHFTVYSGSANVDGLTLKMFAPVPPALKK